VQRSLAPLSLLDPAAVEALTGEPAGAHAWQALEELRGMDDLVAYLRGLAEERRLDAPAGEPQRRHIERLCGTEPPTRRRNLHMMLVGPPGTGKTTAAHLVGRVYRAAGLLPLGHLHKVTRKDLVGAYQGHSAIRTDEAVRAALGGVLFVDEAYDLWHGDGDAFGIEALNTLLEAMSARQGELAVILAGYPADMERLFTANSGFGRRVPEAQRFSLPPAKPEELVSVFAAHVQRDSLLEGLTPALAEGLLPMFRGMVGEADAHFGNFGAAVNLFEACRTAAIRRGARTLDVEDFPAAQRRLLEQPETTPDGLLAQLDAMPGLLRAKAAIRTIAARLRYQRALAFDSARVGVGHMVFAGNPGTGKTSVARLFAEQLAALGVVQRRGLHETTARALIGRHVGDTENNTREFLEKGLGGVIFIDEAHQLERGGGASIDYGRQVIDELVPFAENHRHECVIVLAGYPAALARMMEYDEGLTGRFPGWIPFDDCSDDEMLQIVELLAERHEPVPLSLTAGARSALLRAFAQRRCEMGATFDNARGARTLLEASIGALALRFDPAVEKPPTTIEERDVPGSERARQGGDVSREDARWRNI
jgi:AAA+ superfamily predicted ATPase